MGSVYHMCACMCVCVGGGVVEGKIIKVELWGAHRGCGWGGR